MGTMRYTVTTITKRCPHCGEKIDEETHGEFTPFYGIVFLFTFPILIPYWIIRYLALRNPDYPSIGPKTTPCPHCSLPIRTNNHAIEDLDEEGLFLLKFKKWAYISYVIGALLGICVFAILVGEPIVSWYGLISLISLVGVVLIIIAYHIKLERIAHSKEKILKQPNEIKLPKKTPIHNDNTSFLYCRKCGIKLPSDSQFCNKCGTEVIK